MQNIHLYRQGVPRRFRLTRLASAVLVATSAAVPVSTLAQSEVVEEIIVTGSYIRRAPEDAPSPIRVISRAEIEASGRPQLADFVRNLPSVVGSENITAQESSVGGAGAANINIRNLGLASTLVLLDGKRLNVGTSISNFGEQFVDINRIPFIMIENIEILKDGASATFGSDAVAGVANFKLRNNFDGFEVQAMYQDGMRRNELNFDKLGLPERFREPVESNSGNKHSDMDLSAIWGFGNDRTRMVIGATYFERDPLQTLDRQFGAENAVDPDFGGPSPFNLPQDMFSEGVIPGVGTFPNTALISDASCVELGNYRTTTDRGRINSGLCSTKADLLARDMYSQERRKQALGTWTHAFTDRVEAYGHFGFTENKVLINQSPSFPLTSQPQFDSANPGFQFEVLNGYNELFTTGQAPFGDDVANRLASLIAGGPYPLPVLPFAGQFDPATATPQEVLDATGRITFNGVIRPSLQALQEIRGIEQADGTIFRHRNTSTIERRSKIFMIGARGDLNDQWNFDTSFSYSDEKGETIFRDAVNQRVNDGLNGFFGCNRTDPTQQAGVGDCTWFNPFGSSILLPDVEFADGNGNIHTLGNDPALVKAMEGTGVTNSTTRLTVADFVVSTNDFMGMTLPGGAVGFAAGMQYREERMSTGGNDLATDPSFPFAFTGPSIPFSGKQDIWAIFTELALPVTDTLDVQFALRYEDYGGGTGDTLDPKLAFRWGALDNVVLRGSIGTSFRGPSLNQKFGRGTGLQFIVPPPAEVVAANFPGDPTATFGSGVFARIPTSGNPNLQPEESTNFNVGMIWDATENLTVSVDYWNYRFKDMIVSQDARGHTNDCQIQWHAAGRPSFGSAAYLDVEACNFRNLDGDPNSPDIRLDAVGNPLSIQNSFTNGTRMNVAGLDFLIRYDMPTDVGTFSSTLDLAWFLKFDADRNITQFDTRLRPGETVDLVGVSTSVMVARPLPEYKATLFNDWRLRSHYATLSASYVSNLVEPNSTPINHKIKSHYTIDGSYTYNFDRWGLAVTGGGVNLLDRDPPQASGFNGFAPTLHDPRGRLWYLRARYAM